MYVSHAVVVMGLAPPHQNYFSLVKRLGITAAQELTGGRGREWCKSGVLEFLDFTSDDRLDVPQTRSINFISPQHDAYVNAVVSQSVSQSSSTPVRGG